MKIKGFLKFSTPTTLLDYIIILSSFVISGIIMANLDVNYEIMISTWVAFFVMIIIKYFKFIRN